jgi:hypothetical protein
VTLRARLRSASVLQPRASRTSAFDKRRLDDIMISARRLRATHTWMTSLAGRDGRIGRLEQSIVNGAKGLNSTSATDRSRGRGLTAKPISTETSKLNDYLLNNRKILNWLPGLATQLNEIDDVYGLPPAIATLTSGSLRSQSLVALGSKENAASATAYNASIRQIRRASGRPPEASRILTRLSHRHSTLAEGRPLEMQGQLTSGGSSRRLTLSMLDFESTVGRQSTGKQRLVDSSRRSRFAEAGSVGPTPTEGGAIQRRRSALPLVQRLSYLPESRLPPGRDTQFAGHGDRLGIALQRSTAFHLNSIRGVAQGNRTPGPLPAGGIASRSRAHRSAFASPEIFGHAASAAKSANFGKGAVEGSTPVVVNFSPTVVLQGGMDPGDLERRVVQAIGRHSHELVRIVARELQSQRRAAF